MESRPGARVTSHAKGPHLLETFPGQRFWGSVDTMAGNVAQERAVEAAESKSLTR